MPNLSMIEGISVLPEVLLEEYCKPVKSDRMPISCGFKSSVHTFTVTNLLDFSSQASHIVE